MISRKAYEDALKIVKDYQKDNSEENKWTWYIVVSTISFAVGLLVIGWII